LAEDGTTPKCLSLGVISSSSEYSLGGEGSCAASLVVLVVVLVGSGVWSEREK